MRVTRMSRTRIFQAVPLNEHAIIRLDENASHHLARVLRATMGDSIFLFNGNGNEYAAVIKHIDKKSVEVEITNEKLCRNESPIAISLAQGIARGEKMDFIVQKAVELGVNQIFPLVTERCNVKLKGEREDKRLQHWQSVAISASEQCGRCLIPEVHAPRKLETWLSQIKADICFVLSPHVENTLSLRKTTVVSSVALLIGPEGGLSEHEISVAIQIGFQPLKLGPRILRTETATIAALTAMQVKFGDL